MKEEPKSIPIVFVVDDDASMRNALANLFRSVGLQSALFGSGSELLGSKLPDIPSCLVLDIRLPGVSGLDFQAELAKANIHIPIIFMTGHGDIPMSVQAMKAGAVDFLSKPFRDQDMLDAVTTAIERDRKRRESEKAVAGLRRLLETLTAREREVMVLVTAGLMNTDSGCTGRERDYREDSPRPHYEKNGRKVLGRSGENGRSPGDSTDAAIRDANLSMISRSCLMHQFRPVGILPMQTAR